jgi:GNAT superfamily N-acetyltransferase
VDDLARQRAAVVAVWRADVATRDAGDWADLGDVAVHTTGLPAVHWNGAHVTGPAPDLVAARAWFAQRGMPWGVLVPAEAPWVPPTRHVLDQPVMLRRLAGLPPPPDLELRWDAGEDASAVQAEAFGDEPATTRAFVLPKLVNDACAVVVAYADGAPVATATLVVADGVAGVYGVGTAVGARRRGLGRAVTLAVLHEAVRRGCDLAFLNPSPRGHGVYAGLGFRDAAPWRVYSAFAETDGAAE